MNKFIIIIIIIIQNFNGITTTLALHMVFVHCLTKQLKILEMLYQMGPAKQVVVRFVTVSVLNEKEYPHY
jgi:hypothetical protein